MDRLLISFSGGRTSAYMTKRLLDERGRGEHTVVVFANTGQEHEETLRFVDRCDREFGFGVVWIEALVRPEMGAGTGAKVVSFESAARNGEPLEAVIAKHGIPNRNSPHCTRGTKTRPIQAYAKSMGWATGTYDTAIGIRADEADRVSAAAATGRIVYPPLRWGVTKAQVLKWWRAQAFDLGIPEHLGNCTWCWKKSRRKLLTLAAEAPEVFDFPARMEAAYPFIGAGEGPHRFFRDNWTTLDLKARARLPFKRFADSSPVFDPALDVGGGCGESCEVWADEGVTHDLFAEAA